MGISHSVCKNYGRTAEITLHDFCDWPIAMQIWENNIPTNILNEFLQVDFTNWITLNIDTKHIIDNP